MKGYKVFNPDWTCNGYQYEVGQIFTEDVVPRCCVRGFHFCTEIADCFSYYDFNHDNKVAEVEALGDIDTIDTNSKCCTNKIHIIREITWQEAFDLVNIEENYTGYCNSGSWNSGYCNSGYYNTGKSPEGYFTIGLRLPKNLDVGMSEKREFMKKSFSKYMQKVTGYQCMTTFFEDFSIAERFGYNAVEDTFNRAFNEWKTDYKYLTELVMILNWKIWQFHGKCDDLALLYDKCWRIADNYAMENLQGEELRYFIRTID